MRKITEIVVHCTATPEGRDFSVAQIDAMHRQRGFSGIGYHFLIGLDGTVRNGRPVEKVGAHVVGRNANTIGVAYVGGVTAGNAPKDTRTFAQKQALLVLLQKLVDQHKNIRTISGHRQYANKACPCFDARAEYADLVANRARFGLMSEGTEPESYRVADRGFALLDQPFGAELAPLAKGATVETLGLHEGDFVRVAYGDQAGWVHASALDDSEVRAPLATSRTMQGVAAAGIGLVGDFLTQLSPMIGALGEYTPWIASVAKLIAVAGLAFAFYARFSEAMPGRSERGIVR